MRCCAPWYREQRRARRRAPPQSLWPSTDCARAITRRHTTIVATSRDFSPAMALDQELTGWRWSMSLGAQSTGPGTILLLQFEGDPHCDELAVSLRDRKANAVKELREQQTYLWWWKRV